MKIVKTLDELRFARAQLPRPVGLVPTMGFLHAGHVSLVRQARTENKSVIATIFVNPTQFGEGEDLDTYPRDTEGDLAKFEEAGVDLVWMPTSEIMYPDGYQTTIAVSEVTQYLEGPNRPGHFEGVATVVAKLFNATQADRAYFGQKDAQQTVVIRRMVQDLNMPIEIVICPTTREADGLAMSSRNTYLTPEQREAAPVLYNALSKAKAAYEAGERSGDIIRGLMSDTINESPHAQLEYVSCAHPATLEELNLVAQDMLLSMAVRVGKPRLIDNFLLENGVWLTGEKNIIVGA
jgi:pantoate--beta-alanine ligase